MSSDLGAKPVLSWIPINKLFIDESYQREIVGRQSQNIIAQIETEFRWAKFQALTVSAREGGLFAVIDGQHRLAGAKRRGGLKELPCIIIDSANTQTEASAFVAVNKNRTNIMPQAQYAAAIVSGDPLAVRLNALLKKIDISIPRSNRMSIHVKPREVLAVGTLLRCLKKHGEDNLKYALTAIAEAYPDTNGQMRSMLIQTLVEIYARWGGAVDRDQIIETLEDIDPEDLQKEASNYAKINGGSTCKAMLTCLVRLYNKPLKKAERLGTDAMLEKDAA